MPRRRPVSMIAIHLVTFTNDIVTTEAVFLFTASVIYIVLFKAL